MRGGGIILYFIGSVKLLLLSASRGHMSNISANLVRAERRLG